MKTLALVLLLALSEAGIAGRVEGAAQAAPAEPPYGISFDGVSLDREGERLVLKLQASTDLPPGAVLDLVLTPVVERYDDRTGEIRRGPAERPLRRTVRVEAAGAKGEIRLSQPFPRAGELRVEALFNPEHPLQDAAALRKAMGGHFRAWAWVKSLPLGGADLRLEAVLARWDAQREWIREGEAVARRLAQAAERKGLARQSEAAQGVCADLNALLSKLEKAHAQSPFPATHELLRDTLGSLGNFGSILANAAGVSGKQGRDATFDGTVGGAAESGEEKAVAAEVLARTLAGLERSRDLMVREVALGAAVEIGDLHRHVAALLKDAPSDLKARKRLRVAVLRGKSAAKKLHDFGLSKAGPAYRALFGPEERPEQAYAEALARLDRAAALLDGAEATLSAPADEYAAGHAALESMAAKWRKLAR